MRRLAAVALLACSGAFAAPQVETFGPFEIETVEKSIGAGGFPNTTSNPFARTKVTVFRVKHRGARVVVTDGNAKIDEFWEAKVLAGAPRPALLLAVTGAYLASDESGALKVDILAASSSDIAYRQWLDGKDGRPGPERGAFIRHAGNEPRTESEGTLLLVNRRAVLDVRTLSIGRVEVTSYENVRRLDGYYAGGQAARALSPSRAQYVLVANRNAGDKGYDYALVAAEPATGRMYHVPFDRNALRFESVEDATPEWIARNFEWKREAAGERLALRKDAKPAPWMGRIVRFGGGMVEYRLEPTDARMFNVLYDFVARTFGAVPGPSPIGLTDGPQSKVLMLEGQGLRVAHFADQRSTAIFVEQKGPPQAGYAWIEKIARRFDEELAGGKHQELFTEFRQ